MPAAHGNSTLLEARKQIRLIKTVRQSTGVLGSSGPYGNLLYLTFSGSENPKAVALQGEMIF